MAEKSKVDVGKGFKRIYFTLSAIWIIGIGAVYLDMVGDMPTINVFFGLIVVFAPIPLYFVLLFFIKGFKK